MNNIRKLVKQYNRFIEDLKNLRNAIYELLINEFKLTFVKENWLSKGVWSLKERYCGLYRNEKIVFFVCIDLISDIPYIQFLKCDVNLKKENPEAFRIDDGFDHIEDDEIKKEPLAEYFMSFKQDWGKCVYCKINLSSIESDEVVNRDIKKVLECMMKNNYKNNDFNKLEFL